MLEALAGPLMTLASILSTDSSGSDTAEAAVETTLDVLGLAWHAALGAAIGVVVAFIFVVAGRAAGRRRVLWIEVTRFCRNAAYATAVLTGLYLGAQVAVLNLSAPTWTTVVMRVLLIAVILAITWFIVGVAKAAEATIVDHVRENGDEGRANRVTTQTQILRRVTEVVIVACGIIGAIMTFPSARVAVGSLLASAGLISVIAGLAAQSTLGNVFAGIQLATTDAIRVDDVVVVEGENGRIEEITLTYVVVRIWDDRRLILPSKYFAEKPFANWSRRGTQVTGSLTMDLDWRVPVSALRAQLARVVAASPLWDGRDAALAVTGTEGGKVSVRITVSGANPGDVFDLKCHIQEELVAWLQAEAPDALPRTRVEVDHVDIVHDPAPEKVARLAEELTHLAAPAAVDPDPTDPDAVAVGADPVEAARVRASARRSSSARRRRRERRRQRMARGREARQAPELTERQGAATQVISTGERQLYLDELEEQASAPPQSEEQPAVPSQVPVRGEAVVSAPSPARVEDLRRTSIIAKVETEASRKSAPGSASGAGSEPGVSTAGAPRSTQEP